MTTRDDFDIYGGQWRLMSRYELKKKTAHSLNFALCCKFKIHRCDFANTAMTCDRKGPERKFQMV